MDNITKLRLETVNRLADHIQPPKSQEEQIALAEALIVLSSPFWADIANVPPEMCERITNAAVEAIQDECDLIRTEMN